MKKSKENKLYEFGNQIEIDFVILDRSHRSLVKQFKCGNDFIDKFVQTISYKDKETVTRAAIDVKNNLIIAIFTVVATGIYTNPSTLSLREKMLYQQLKLKILRLTRDIKNCHIQKIRKT